MQGTLAPTTARLFQEVFDMTLLAHIPKAAMVATGVALAALAYAPSAQAFGGHGGGGHFGGGYGGYGGWGYPYYGVGLGVWPYDDDYGYYNDDVTDCTLRRVHVHTVYGWRWRTYEIC
jgi:opacity protein-like surface antigen